HAFSLHDALPILGDFTAAAPHHQQTAFVATLSRRLGDQPWRDFKVKGVAAHGTAHPGLMVNLTLREGWDSPFSAWRDYPRVARTFLSASCMEHEGTKERSVVRNSNATAERGRFLPTRQADRSARNDKSLAPLRPRVAMLLLRVETAA